ncbi:nucleoside-diphosphate sugar epimerase/dehydratase [Mycobacterium sp. URHB0044]|jgi:FlaA1/EpsC-like NDP-sugar epimerase|uniref:nucleoside-diphosphate sugar epimerase/dehydratase n=1 Tax=Mycobacterium sp. URHB0044 TaxID=1380386 RepID=UPI0009DCD136|nr:nucleoside-diphosphate sugar epimerase/dehydratase [Mycobacterium sp. URHB0044]
MTGTTGQSESDTTSVPAALLRRYGPRGGATKNVPVSPWWVPDTAIWFIAVWVATWARFDFDFEFVKVSPMTIVALSAVLANVVVGGALGIYRHRYIVASFEESVALAAVATISSTLLLLSLSLLTPFLVPRSVPLLSGTFALGGMLAVRWIGRTLVRRHRKDDTRRRKVVVLGAGSYGQNLVRQMQLDERMPFEPVALLDDDPGKRRLHVAGVQVRGTRRDLASVITRFGADAVVIAISDPDPELVRGVSTEAALLGIGALIVPPVSQLVRSARPDGDVRDLNLHDLLGRSPAHLGEEAIAAEIAGRRVLVTGAGGSIGSEMCRQIHRLNPAALVMLDRDESALHAAQLSIHGRAMLDNDETVLADIRDLRAMRRIFDVCRPEVVIHAAALKHLPLLEKYPLEAWMTNVVGSWNVLRAAQESRVETFVNISTDKAANPTSVLGYSKRVTERLTASAATCMDDRFLSVRFGNVLGSRGSVLEAFARQIEEGGPVTVTHPDVTRFFMTIPEACQLVLQAAAIGSGSEALVLDMGAPVRIDDVARSLIYRAQRNDVEIVYTGLRAGEKLHEELFGCSEVSDYRPSHPLVSHVHVPPLALLDGETSLDRFADHDSALRWMASEAAAMPASVIELTQRLMPERGLTGATNQARGYAV